MSAKSALHRHQRQMLLRELIGSELLYTQAEIVRRLSDEGIEANQATVSRDLEDLGAIVVKSLGNKVYAIPEAPDSTLPTHRVQNVLSAHVSEITEADHLHTVFVRPIPPMAALVGTTIDRAGVPGVLAVVTTDTSVAVVCTEGGSPFVFERLSVLGGLA